ncbi:unnamed protein product [Diabrotica balteata]|uniref:Uncharacterized protein n=1 Tax=Diabrotica balteata TaxID=107213 RepID=A0A9N9XCN1_DIABA|nr:unnamed protein product [Diabrotica balteata]
MSCDEVEQQADELIRICTYIYIDTGDKKAVMLADMAKELRPTFSAAGFFKVNRRILPTFFANISTYLIILLQFKASF